MTSDQTQSLREDIAYMKVLADEGMSTPLVGGPILMMFGIVFGVFNLGAWYAGRFMDVTGKAQFWISMAAMAVCVICLPLLILRARKQPGYNSPANRAFGMAWASVGTAIGVMAVIVYIACSQARSPLPAAVMPSAVLCFYAVGWTVAAAMTRQRFLWIVALACYLSAFIAVLTYRSPDFNLILGGIIILVALVPGTILFLREPKSVI